MTLLIAQLTLAANLLAQAPAAGEDAAVKLIAHRGGVVDHNHIENNLPAIDEAVRRGYWMLEVDVRESRDGRPIVQHDADFRRFYGDPRKVGEMTVSEIKQLRSTPGGLPPLEFAEFCAACQGRIRLMLDTKDDGHDDAFFAAMLEALSRHDLLDSAYVIGSDQSRAVFAGKARLGINRQGLDAALARGEDVAGRYFLFEHAVGMTDETVRLCQQHGVVVVPSVNTFHYKPGQGLRRAAADVARLKNLGVTHFQIDSVYETFCIDR